MRNFNKIGFMLICLLFLFQGQALVLGRAVATAPSFDADVPDETSATYSNLYDAVQGETNASAAYTAFAAKADAEGYPVIARLFRATAAAESKHANDEWIILEGMGATDRPEADAPTVGTTAENLKAAFDGETYEYTTMYKDFLAKAQEEEIADAIQIFNRAMKAEEVHAGNYEDVLNNLDDDDYINKTYGTVFRCPVCGEVVTERPAANCPICHATGTSFEMYNETYDNLFAAVQGETNASAAYKAFAEKADEEGYPVIARLFLATSAAEAKHAADEWEIFLKGMGLTPRPTALTPTVGTTAENLKAAFDGETYEYTIMYAGFLTTAEAEGMTEAAHIFEHAMLAEEVHAGNYDDVLNNLGVDDDYIDSEYVIVYRCPVCGEVVTTRPANCPICTTPGTSFKVYNETYSNLFASVQGETNASAAYKAFAAKAKEEDYPVVARLFLATADAEAKHADDEWKILEGMGATDRPVADTPTVGTTEENLETAFKGETHEYTKMYKDFLAKAQDEEMEDAARIFNLAMQAEEVHAGNYDDVLKNLDDEDYIFSKYAVVYRCPVCGEVVTVRPTRCPICNAAGNSFKTYCETYDNLNTTVQGETNANAAYKAFADKADEEGYPVIARLFLATADAEAKHADDEWKILQSMGATDRPVAETPKVGTTAENLKAAFDGETYEYTVMYKDFLQIAQDEGITDAARIFNLAKQAEEVHAGNYDDVLSNLGVDDEYIISEYMVLYRCPVCGEVVTERPANCPICHTAGSSFITYCETYSNLYEAVKGETNANAAYLAFAEKAEEEGYPAIARLFRATADAEAQHADDEWTILESMGATVRPLAVAPIVGTTADNLKAAFDGENFEYTTMYPGFLTTAQTEGMTDAARIFNLAMKAEQVHAGNFGDILSNLGIDDDYIDSKYTVVYRCPVCGEVVIDLPDLCPICRAPGGTFVMYSVVPIIIASLPDGIIGEEYNQSLVAIGGSSITWAIKSGDLPTGLSLDPVTGVISGKPTKAGEFSFTVTATNSYGVSTAVTFSILINFNTGIDNIQLGKALSVYGQDGKMHINGLSSGNILSVYHISGQLVHQSVAVSNQAVIPLITRGVYIVKSGNKTVKVLF